MGKLEINTDILHRLQARADQEQCSIDDLLARWLSTDAEPPNGESIERTRADASLRALLERNQRVLRSMFDGYLLGTADGRLLDVNQAYCDMMGYTREEVLNKTIFELDANYSPDEIEQLSEKVNESNPIMETRHFHKDGHAVDVEISSVQIDDGYFVSFIRDISRRKQNEAFLLDYERLKARFQKEQGQNLLIQRLISALSHDLRSILAVIATTKDLLIHYSEKITPKQRQEKLAIIGRQLQLAVDLLDDTVMMVRDNLDGREFRPTKVNLASLCRISIEELGGSKGRHHRLRFINTGKIEFEEVDEILVSRILLNLLSNAIKYSPQGSEIHLELDHHDSWLVLKVSDQGTGITPDELPLIFEPFYRATNAEGIEGTGLGLSIVKDCVERHHGRIKVESRVNVGTVFTVELPAKITAIPQSATA